MSVSYIDIDNASFELQLTLTPEEYAKKFKKNINKFAQGVAMKGFRKGFTPVGMIMKLQGNQLLTQTLMELIDEQSGNYITENNITIYISGNISENAFDGVDYTQLDKTYTFSMPYIKHVPFNLAEFAETGKHTFKKYVAQISDEELNTHIEKYLLQIGEVEEVGDDVLIEENDIIDVALTAYDEDNNKIEEVSADVAYLLPKLLVDESEKNKLIGKKLQESGTINLLKAFDKTDKKLIALQVLGLKLTDEEAAQKMPDEYQFTINRIRRRVPAQLTEEVIFAAFPRVGATTEEEFKDLFKGYLEKQAYLHSKQLLKNQLITWMQHYDYNFPEEILENNYNRAKATGKSKDMLPWEEVRELEINNLRLHSIVQSIVRSQDIKVTEEELLAHTAADLKHRLVQSGYPESIEIEEEMAINYLNSDKEYSSTMLRHIATEKALDYLIEEVLEPEIEEISFSELMEKE